MRTPRTKVLLLAAMCFVVFASVASAQAASDVPDKTWFELLKTTGFVGIMMVATSMTGTALVIEHIVNIRREKMAPTPLAQDLQALIEEGQYDEAIELCDQEGGYLSNLVGSALRLRHAGYSEMISSLEAAANE
jgi:biopolymer transport protein ExbB